MIIYIHDKENQIRLWFSWSRSMWSSPLFEKIPKAEEGEADEKTKRSSNVRYHWDKWEIINLEEKNYPTGICFLKAGPLFLQWLQVFQRLCKDQILLLSHELAFPRVDIHSRSKDGGTLFVLQYSGVRWNWKRSKVLHTF